MANHYVVFQSLVSHQPQYFCALFKSMIYLSKPDLMSPIYSRQVDLAILFFLSETPYLTFRVPRHRILIPFL